VVDHARYVVNLATGTIGSLGGQVVVTLTAPGEISLRCFDANTVVDGVTRRDSSLTALRVHQATQVSPPD
jgi:hypothetical protein